MGKKLAITVFVTPPGSSEAVPLLPGTEPEDWALEQITNPNVWEGDGDAEDAELSDLKKDELLAVAEERGVEVHKSWSNDRIIAAIEAGPPEGVKVTESG